MKNAPKIYLVHAAEVSIAPVVSSFRAAWPEARLANLLDDAFMPDLAADGRLTDEMIGRFVHIGEYCVKAGADAILFACSAFSPAIEECRRQLKIPVLKPNEAMYEQLVAKNCSVSLLATFPPSIPSMVPVLKLAAARTNTPILTTPDSAVAKSKTMLA